MIDLAASGPAKGITRVQAGTGGVPGVHQLSVFLASQFDARSVLKERKRAYLQDFAAVLANEDIGAFRRLI